MHKWEDQNNFAVNRLEPRAWFTPLKTQIQPSGDCRRFHVSSCAGGDWLFHYAERPGDAPEDYFGLIVNLMTGILSVPSM